MSAEPGWLGSLPVSVPMPVVGSDLALISSDPACAVLCCAVRASEVLQAMGYSFAEAYKIVGLSLNITDERRATHAGLTFHNQFAVKISVYTRCIMLLNCDTDSGLLVKCHRPLVLRGGRAGTHRQSLPWPHRQQHR